MKVGSDSWDRVPHFFLRLPPPWWIFYFLRSCYISHMQRNVNELWTNTSHTWIGIVFTNYKKKGRLLALSFKPVTFQPRSSIYSGTFLTGIGQFHGSTWLSPLLHFVCIILCVISCQLKAVYLPRPMHRNLTLLSSNKIITFWVLNILWTQRELLNLRSDRE